MDVKEMKVDQIRIKIFGKKKKGCISECEIFF